MSHSFEVADTHPALAGHFPGRPVTPGVVVLSEAIAAAAEALPGWRVVGVQRAKFILPVQPGARCAVAFGPVRAGQVSASITAGDQLAVTAQFRLAETGRDG